MSAIYSLMILNFNICMITLILLFILSVWKKSINKQNVLDYNLIIALHRNTFGGVWRCLPRLLTVVSRNSFTSEFIWDISRRDPLVELLKWSGVRSSDVPHSYLEEAGSLWERKWIEMKVTVTDFYEFCRYIKCRED